MKVIQKQETIKVLIMKFIRIKPLRRRLFSHVCHRV